MILIYASGMKMVFELRALELAFSFCRLTRESCFFFFF